MSEFNNYYKIQFYSHYFTQTKTCDFPMHVLETKGVLENNLVAKNHFLLKCSTKHHSPSKDWKQALQIV